jgi:uncharacterized surface protein with fasciclin (FAS1) repeats
MSKYQNFKNMMLKLLKSVILICLILLASCEKEKFKQYYERPSNLEPPIYANLQALGKFSSYLACVDKAGFNRLLSKTGYITVLAPTDSAFNVYLAENGLTSVDQIDTATAKKIVAYSILPDVYTSDQLDDYQSSALRTTVPDLAFKRKTSYYKWIYTDTANGQPVKVIDANGVGFESGSSYVYSTDNNNKDIPFFTTNFLANNNITATDYNYFFPNATFNGFNVADAQLIGKDIWAENGIIHIVNKVILPLPNLDEYLSSNPNYSKFRQLLDIYSKEVSNASDDITLRYEQNTGHYEKIYQKIYNDIVFAPNCENFMKFGGGETYDDQKDGWTIFVPTNEAINTFFQNKFLTYFSNNINNVPPAQVLEFINAHMFRTTVWPSKFNVTQNYFGEEARFDLSTNVIDKKMCSNGIFYGVNKIQETDAFYTLLGDISLNPNYSLMLQALRTTQLYYLVKNRAIDLQVILLNNAQIQSIGLNYNYGTGTWDLTNTSLGTNATTALERILNLHIFLNKNINLAQRGFVESYGGEYVRFQYLSASLGTTFYCPGKTTPRIKLYNTNSNGRTYFINPPTGQIGDPLTYSTDNIGAKIEGSATSAFGEFYRYLEKSAKSTAESDPAVSMNGFIYDLNTKAITGVKITENTTVIIPNNAAMQKAVTDGVLPAITSLPFTQAEQEKVQKFINYHILSKLVLVPDGLYNGPAATHYSTQDGTVYVTILNTAPANPATTYGTIQVTDKLGRVAKSTATVPTLSNRSIIIQVDNYLRYE